jgi:hypothetical protein
LADSDSVISICGREITEIVSISNEKIENGKNAEDVNFRKTKNKKNEK